MYIKEIEDNDKIWNPPKQRESEKGEKNEEKLEMG